MGTPTNYLLGNQSTMLGADPELYRQQLIQQEQQRIGALPAQQQLGAQLGSLLGRGVTNVAQGRGFFEVTNPVLQKLTQVQDIYNTSMKEADPNDPLSFYTTLQKNFASAGLGQQALMAATEAKKFEDMDLKSEKLRTEVYTQNPSLLDAKIAQARDAGDDKTANMLADQRGKIQVKIDLDRAKEVADINYKNAATAAQRAQASKLSQDIESGKFDWKVINDAAGIPTHMAKINKKTGETSYEPITLPPGVNTGTKPTTPTKGERPDLSTFGGSAPSTPAPVAASASATPQAELPALDPQTRIYYAARDPVLKSIQAAVQADPNRLATDPEWFKQLTNARNQQLDYLRNQYGNMVSFQGL
jgi:hypothetical protein